MVVQNSLKTKKINNIEEGGTGVIITPGCRIYIKDLLLQNDGEDPIFVGAYNLANKRVQVKIYHNFKNLSEEEKNMFDHVWKEIK